MMLCFKRSSFCYFFVLIYFSFQACLLYYLTISKRGETTSAASVFDTYKSLGHKLNEASQTDISAKYKILPLTSTVSKNLSFDITLVSQCSSNHIHLIKDLINVWNGPVSIAVFEGGENIEKTLWDLSKLLNCWSNEDFKIHLVVPAKNIYIINLKHASDIIKKSGKFIDCQFFLQKSKKNYDGYESYPINLLRNIAKTASSTEYVFMIDIDMTPSANLRNQFLNYIMENPGQNKVAYVVPAFEIDENHRIPGNKKDLLNLIRENVVRPFYFVPCPNCQKATLYDNWMLSNISEGTRTIYEVEWKYPWEPFFIAKSDMPNFDERFKQYGLNRVSQICELHVAGYKFYVLGNVYLMHRGLKLKKDFHATKNAEMDSNRVLYNHFKHELKFRYPNSEKRC